MKRGLAHSNVIMGDYNAQARKKVTGESMVGKHGLDSQNEREQILIDFVESVT